LTSKVSTEHHHHGGYGHSPARIDRYSSTEYDRPSTGPDDAVPTRFRGLTRISPNAHTPVKTSTDCPGDPSPRRRPVSAGM
jgi:hypothetical protein